MYRAAKLLNQRTYIPHAERSRQALSATTSASPSNSGTTLFPSYVHFTRDGVLTPVVDPYMYGSKATGTSPEGQAFVVQMHVAWKEWLATPSGAMANQHFGRMTWITGAVIGRYVVDSILE